MAMAAKHVASFGPSELTFVLDGMARLRVKAPSAFMNALAKQVILPFPLGASPPSSYVFADGTTSLRSGR